MIRLNLPIIDEAIEIGKVKIFVVEDTQCFAQIVRLLYSYDEESELKLFDHKQQSLRTSELQLIIDVLSFEMNTPAILKSIYKDLEKQLNEKPDVKSILEQMMSKISKLVCDELIEHELVLDVEEVAISKLFKLLSVKIESQSQTIAEKCFEIVQLMKYFAFNKLLVFVNACSYLTDDEFNQLYEYIELMQMTVLFLEPRIFSEYPKYVLDEDFFFYYQH